MTKKKCADELSEGDLVMAVSADLGTNGDFSYQYSSPCNLQGYDKLPSIPLTNGTVGIWLKSSPYYYKHLVMFPSGFRLVKSTGLAKVT